MALETLIDLVAINENANGTYIEIFLNGSYTSAQECAADKKLLEQAIPSGLSFNLKYDCLAFEYEFDEE